MRHCMLTAVGTSRVSARQPTYFSCFAKRSRQEKATLRWRSALRADCTRRQHLKREASETRFAQTADASLSVSGTGDASPSNGISLQQQRQRQLQLQLQRQRQRHAADTGPLRYGCFAAYSGRTDEKDERELLQQQLQQSLRGATGNRNGRCAEPQATATVAARSYPLSACLPAR